MPAFAKASARHFSFRSGKKSGGADRDQTDDLVVANDALYQLSYCPVKWNGLIAARPRPSKLKFCAATNRLPSAS